MSQPRYEVYISSNFARMTICVIDPAQGAKGQEGQPGHGPLVDTDHWIGIGPDAIERGLRVLTIP